MLGANASSITSNSVGKRVCIVRRVRPMKPVIACGLQRKMQNVYSFNVFIYVIGVWRSGISG